MYLPTYRSLVDTDSLLLFKFVCLFVGIFCFVDNVGGC
jgi:hypothetical protein